MDIAKLVIIAILVEAIWENLKMVWQAGKVNVDAIGSLILGIIVCIVAKLDIFALVGFGLSAPILGWIFTGIICSRGANYLHDLFKKLKGE